MVAVVVVIADAVAVAVAVAVLTTTAGAMIATIATTVTTSQHAFPAIWQEKKGSSSPLSISITRLTITSKWSIAMMEIFLSLDKYPALCKPKSLGDS